jgi:hypothetical protein
MVLICFFINQVVSLKILIKINYFHHFQQECLVSCLMSRNFERQDALMKSKLLALTLLSLSLVTACDVANDTLFVEETIQSVCPEDAVVGACAAIQDEALDLNKMLTYSLQDEYLAHHKYDVLIHEKGYGKPFTNIILAEQSHIEALLPLFDWYGVEPVDPISLESFAVIPETLQAALQIGVDAEILNIHMYDIFLDHDIPTDVQDVFIRLKDASVNHLNAFQRNLDRL